MGQKSFDAKELYLHFTQHAHTHTQYNEYKKFSQGLKYGLQVNFHNTSQPPEIVQASLSQQMKNMFSSNLKS